MDREADENLVEKVKRGNIGAFEMLVGRYEKKLLWWVENRVGNFEGAQGEVMQTVWEELPRFKLGVILVAGAAGWSLWRKWPVVREKIAYLTKYRRKE